MRNITIAIAILLPCCIAVGCDRTKPGGNPPAAAPTAKALKDKASAGAPELIVTPTGYGKFRFGMSVHEAEVALGEDLHVSPADLAEEEGCTYGAPASFPTEISFMVTNSDGVARLDVGNHMAKTPQGFGVGSNEKDIVAAFGSAARVEPSPYDGPEYHDIVYLLPTDTMFGYVFQTDGRVVISFRAGRQPALLYIEGCS